MTKLLAAIAATFLAITAIASGAEAGFNVRISAPTGFSEVHKAGCGGGSGYRRTKRRVEVASRKVSKPTVVAKAEPKVEPIDAAPEQTVAEVENSSISTEEGAVEKVAEVKVEKPVKKLIEQKIASAKDLGCKTFFASVGMTLSVPCAK
jgi:hypothetical protein